MSEDKRYVYRSADGDEISLPASECAGLGELLDDLSPKARGPVQVSDDRDDEQRETLTALVVGRDPGMSGWGGCRFSWAAWACAPADVDAVAEWVEARGDIVDITEEVTDYVPDGDDRDRFHIYAADAARDHPALDGAPEPEPVKPGGCADLVAGKLADRLDDLRKLWDLWRKDPNASDEDLGSLRDFGYGASWSDWRKTDADPIEGSVFYQWTLSGGGPSDEFRFHPAQPDEALTKARADGTITVGQLERLLQLQIRIEYRYHDWFDGAGIDLGGDNRELLMDIWRGFFDAPALGDYLGDCDPLPEGGA